MHVYKNTIKRVGRPSKKKRGAKILIMAVCGAVLDTPLQMDTWM